MIKMPPKRTKFSCFTPITKLDFQPPIKWAKVSRLKIKKITDAELLDYFGIRSREFNKNGKVTELYVPKSSPINVINIKDVIVYNLQSSKYAFVSDLNNNTHISEVKTLLTAFRLYRLNSVTCPITFEKERIIQHFIYPIESKIKKETEFSKSDLIKISHLIHLVKKVEPEDIELLDLVTELGVRTLSLVLLVIILERTIMQGDSGEISFKVRLYGSKLLSKYFQYNEKKVYDTLHEGYKLRSKFMHEHKKNEDKVKMIFDNLYDYTVKILRIKAEHKNIRPDMLIKLILANG